MRVPRSIAAFVASCVIWAVAIARIGPFTDRVDPRRR